MERTALFREQLSTCPDEYARGLIETGFNKLDFPSLEAAKESIIQCWEALDSRVVEVATVREVMTYLKELAGGLVVNLRDVYGLQTIGIHTLELTDRLHWVDYLADPSVSSDGQHVALFVRVPDDERRIRQLVYMERFAEAAQ